MSTDQAVVVWGELLWDRFPDGHRLGGAPTNCAWHLGQAGGWAQLVTRVGDDDDGHRAIAQLEPFVDTTYIQLDRERATGEVLVELDRGEARYRLVTGRAWERIACTADVCEAIADAGVLVFGTLAQRTPDGLAGWRAAIGATREGCVRAVDVNLRPADRDTADTRLAIDEAIDVADVVKLNDKELDLLRDWRGWADPVTTLLGRKRRVVVVTHGAAGSTLHGDKGAIEIAPCAASPGGDNVGCGDAYLAILLHGMTLGWDLRASGRLASRWAAAVASVRGATPTFTDEQVADLLELEVAA